MKMHTDLALRTDQRMVLAPKMLQSIEVLQLATADLLAMLDEELEQNETLELIRPANRDEGETADPDSRPDRSEEERPLRRAASRDTDAKQAFLESVPDRAASLQDYIRLQLAWEELPEDLTERVLALAERLDERGLLSETEGELLEALGGEMLDEALAVLQSLEPRGIGARNPIEAMLLQIEESDPDHDEIEAMLTEHLEALARNKVPEVAKALDLTVEDVEALLGRIAELDPRPGTRFSADPPGCIRPDLLVAVEDGQVQVSVDDLALPVLGINEDYEAMAGAAKTEKDVRRYLRGKLQSARELISAIQQRKATLARVGAAIISRQSDFLTHGRSAIRPMKMADVADQLGLHTSTVSRAIAGKYMQTDQGIFSLREFFDGARGQGPDGRVGSTGRMAVKEHVKQLLEAEDARRPMSDDEVVSRLQARGIQVARRTVSKYRHELGIPSSWQRKRFGTKR